MAADSNILEQVHTLTFDVFGTILDLGGSLTPHLETFLKQKGIPLPGERLWEEWRYRQRIEQYQDTLLLLGQARYLDSARRALLYVLRKLRVPFTPAEADQLMEAWRELRPFPDAVSGLEKLGRRFKLVALSNGDRWFLDYLVRERIRFEFSRVISVEEIGAFKPHPSVYRAAARALGAEPHQLMMVSANSFDVMGARSCGYRGAWVDRYGLPYEETPYRPDVVARDFTELAERLYV